MRFLAKFFMNVLIILAAPAVVLILIVVADELVPNSVGKEPLLLLAVIMGIVVAIWFLKIARAVNNPPTN